MGHSALCPYVFLGFGSWADTEVRTLHGSWADTEVRTLHGSWYSDS